MKEILVEDKDHRKGIGTILWNSWRHILHFLCEDMDLSGTNESRPLLEPQFPKYKMRS